MASTSSPLDPSLAPDYIIVGGGTAGLVVASRLTEDPNVRVLVLEAGANYKGDPNVEIPGLMTQLYGKEKYDWNFMSKPQTSLNNRQIACPRGKMLGGSSGVNFCAIVYPRSSDFEAWSELGNKGWTSKDMEPYFRKFQNHYPPASEVAKRMQLHSCVDVEIKRDDGPLPITYLKDYSKSHQAWMESFVELGLDIPGDPIHGKKLGSFTNAVSIHPETQTRAYSASTYYNDRAAARPNLQVMTEVVVKRVILEESNEGAVAKGVEVVAKDGQVSTFSIKQGGEVIVSAGVMKSPQVLELSGIGKEELLRQHNIRPIVSNPFVGENFQDHPWAGISYEVADQMESGDIMRDPANIAAAIQQYGTTKGGPLSGAHLGFAYLPLVDQNGLVDATHVRELIKNNLQPAKDSQDQARQLQYRILERLLEDQTEACGEYMLLPSQLNINAQGATDMPTLFTPSTDGNYISLAAYLNRPFSRGSVHIKSADPQADPDYDPRYLSHPLDLEILARQTMFLENIASSGPMSKILTKDGRRIPTSGAPIDLKTAKDLAVDRCFTAFHPCGTCAMAPVDQGGVVNDRLIVHGTKNLRVVDASIFPIVPVGNIQATVYASAEKASDIIKEDRGSH